MNMTTSRHPSERQFETCTRRVAFCVSRFLFRTPTGLAPIRIRPYDEAIELKTLIRQGGPELVRVSFNPLLHDRIVGLQHGRHGAPLHAQRDRHGTEMLRLQSQRGLADTVPPLQPHSLNDLPRQLRGVLRHRLREHVVPGRQNRGDLLWGRDVLRE